MPNWGEILDEITGTNTDTVRRKYIRNVHEITGRNIIIYYSGFIQKPGESASSISDEDKNGLMAVIHKLDKSKGLDLFLHTPGGGIAATESIIHYLHSIFGNNIRAVIPQMAMSAGTMIALSSKAIIMGKQSSIGPIDPQYGGISAAGVLEEFEQAIKQVTENQASSLVWQNIIKQYHPTFVGDCQKAVDFASKFVQKCLEDCMFEEYNQTERRKRAKKIVNELSDHNRTKSHDRHIPIDDCIRLGINVIPMEEYLKEKNYQDAVLSVHHCCMHTFAMSKAIKIVENHLGSAMIRNV